MKTTEEKHGSILGWILFMGTMLCTVIAIIVLCFIGHVLKLGFQDVHFHFGLVQPVAHVSSTGVCITDQETIGKVFQFESGQPGSIIQQLPMLTCATTTTNTTIGVWLNNDIYKQFTNWDAQQQALSLLKSIK